MYIKYVWKYSCMEMCAYLWKLFYDAALTLAKSLHVHFSYSLKCLFQNIIKCRKIFGALCSHSSLNIVFFLLLFPLVLKNCPDVACALSYHLTL